MTKGILIAYGELFLKSNSVKKIFFQKLENNIRFFLKKEGVDFSLDSTRDRIFVKTNNLKKSLKVLSTIFGIAWYSEAFSFSDLKGLLSFIKSDYQEYIKKNDTFAIRMKHNRDIIDKVAQLIDRKVKLDRPNKELFIEQRGKSFFLYFKKKKGSGGLPYSASGKVLSLVSGGIDSVPAAYLILKRGAECVWLHFHSFPFVSNKSINKVKELALVFKKYQPNVKIYFVPFSDIQLEIKAKSPAKYRVLLYRRIMYQIAAKIAEKESCEALVTGESLAQVSSQTLSSLNIIEEVIKMPVLRPLIGLDKEEIIDIAKNIGTYDISIKPQEDCCTLFVTSHQTAQGNLETIKEIEKKINIKKMIKNVLIDQYNT